MNALVKKFLCTRRGAVAIYAAYVGMLILATCALAIDIGRLGVLRTQLQNAADAAALAGAAQLDGASGAISRASNVAMNAVQNQTNIGIGATEISMQTPTFFRTWNPVSGTGVPAVADAQATFIQVWVQPKNVNLLFRPFIDMISGGENGSVAQVRARAVARGNDIICSAVPIRMCDITSGAFPGMMNPDSAGRQIIMRHEYGHGNAIAIFAMLCPPGMTSCTEAQAIEFADSLDTDDCTADIGRTLIMSEPGIEEAVNGRFGDGPSPKPAENVIYYPDDLDLTGDPIIGGAFGDGEWNPGTYWDERHGEALPPELGGASRYQVYLYELGQAFARDGKKTIYPAPGLLPDGYTPVTPPGSQVPTDEDEPTDRWVDGVPDGGALVADPRRRVMTISLVYCGDTGIYSKVNTGRYMQVFLTRSAEGPLIYTEYLRPLGAQDVNPQFVKNARLVQ